MMWEIIAIINAVEMQTETQVIVPILPLLMMGCIIGVVILILGLAQKKNMLTGFGVFLVGLMIAITPYVWFGYRAIEENGILMKFSDITIITVLSVIGGIIISTGLRRMIKHTK